MNRLIKSILTVPTLQGWLWVFGLLLIVAATAFPIGFYVGFLRVSTPRTWQHSLTVASVALVFPALTEELFFRVLLIPHPTEGAAWTQWSIWAGLSLLLFIVYHPLNAKTFFSRGVSTFFNPAFLSLAGILGAACSIGYALTGSLWAIAFIHWVVVVVWLLWLGGEDRLAAANVRDVGQSN
jgi:predicted Abi (CAAX) family protease